MIHAETNETRVLVAESREADVGRTHRDRPRTRASAGRGGLARRKPPARWRGGRWRYGETVCARGAILSRKREGAPRAIASEWETARWRISRHDGRRPGSFDCIRLTAGVEGGSGRPGEASRGLLHDNGDYVDVRGAPRGASCPTVNGAVKGRCLAGDMGRQTERRLRSRLLQPRGARGKHPRHREVLLARISQSARDPARAGRRVCRKDELSRSWCGE